MSLLTTLLVRPDVALRQLRADRPGDGAFPRPQPPEKGGPKPTAPAAPALPRRFFGAVDLDPLRAGRDIGNIAEEVVQHLAQLPKSRVKITVEIHIDAPEGVPDQIQKVVSENCKTLKFRAHGFEKGE